MTLAGEWDFSIPGGKISRRMVPGSYPCVGEAVYETSFSYRKTPGTRVRLCFEGIAYEGTVSVNGQRAGDMLPYSYYAFDITGLAVDGENRVSLDLMDIFADFGPQTGWSSYSGIVRDVYVETVPKTTVDDVFFHTAFGDGFRSAACTAEITLSHPAPEVSLTLLHEGTAVYSARFATTDGSAVHTFTVDRPLLWSPDMPHLYTLEVRAGEDCVTQTVGFKEFKADGSRFRLNGEEIFLAGVCRHDLQEDPYGFTQTDDQIEKDMRLIKGLGVNYVRLVHYPHDRRVLDAADRLGLLVSEEPGFWWSSMKNEVLVEKGLKVMEKVVRRDRSHVSVAFWLTFNECILFTDFLKRALATTRRADPTRMVSGANCMEIRATKRLFDESGCDFYTFHPYGPEPEASMGGAKEDESGNAPTQTMDEVVRYLCDKPLVFTEWGGNFVHNNPALFERYCRAMFTYGRNRAPEPVLAGMSYWVWADIHEANRPKPGSYDGYMVEGLVDILRNPRVNYDTYMRMIRHFACPPEKREKPAMRVFGAGDPAAEYRPVELPRPEDLEGQDPAWEEAVRQTTVRQWPRRQHVLETGPALPAGLTALGALRADLRAGRPLVANALSGILKIRVGSAGSAVFFIGQASMSYGYPADGKIGDPVGRYVIRYDDGTVQEIPIRNGMEAVTVHKLYNASVIEPTGTGIMKVLEFSYDASFEVYQINLLKVETDASRIIGSIDMEVTDPAYSLLLYGITLEP